MSDLTVISSTQKIFVDPFSSATGVTNDGPSGPPGVRGQRGDVGNGEGYVSDTELQTTATSLDSRLDVLEAKQGGWNALALVGAWTAYGPGWEPPRYRRIDGVVYLQGLIKASSAANDTIAATLPVGFRPQAHVMFISHTAAPNQIGRIWVNTSGSLYFGAGNLGYVSLSGMSYRAA